MLFEEDIEITQFGSKGCSYKQPIKLANSRHIETNSCALKGKNMKFKAKYLAYAYYNDLGLGYFGSNEGDHFFDTDLLIRVDSNSKENLQGQLV